MDKSGLLDDYDLIFFWKFGEDCLFPVVVQERYQFVALQISVDFGFSNFAKNPTLCVPHIRD